MKKTEKKVTICLVLTGLIGIIIVSVKEEFSWRRDQKLFKQRLFEFAEGRY